MGCLIMANEKRLIDVSEWESFYNERTKGLDEYDHFENGYENAFDSVDYWINAQPKVDAVEVVHGQNITKQHPVDEFICSECGLVCRDNGRYVYDEWADDWSLYEFEFKYCPNCGAKMDGDGNG